LSTQKIDGMRYAPKGKPNPVCQKGEFRVAAIGLDHGHIFGMCNGLLEAGAELAWVYDPDTKKVADFCKRYPDTQPAASAQAILDDPQIHLIASASIPVQRCSLGLRAMEHGKDFFADKPPLITREQLAQASAKVAETGRKYAAYYSERLHVECAVMAGDLIQSGAIGRVLQVVNLAPHRLNAPERPDWFFKKASYGGILIDLGSHQIEQFLYYSGAKDAHVLHSKVANYHNPTQPDFEDFGDATLIADNGATHYLRVDWFTPEGLGVWGDGRVFIMGTDGTIELRKYIDIGRDGEGDHLYLVNQAGLQHMALHGQVGFPFFGQLILDCLNRTEKAMTQAHTFKVMELAIQAQEMADKIA
jgi:predicted dehydrogenase